MNTKLLLNFGLFKNFVVLFLTYSTEFTKMVLYTTKLHPWNFNVYYQNYLLSLFNYVMLTKVGNGVHGDLVVSKFGI